MSDTSPLAPDRTGAPGRFPAIAGSVVAALGAGVLLGWMLGAPLLKSIAPGLKAMNPLMAAALVVAGLAVFVRARRPGSAAARRTSDALALVMFAVGVATLLAYLARLNLPLHTLGFAVRLSDGPSALRLPPNGGLILSLLGCALLCGNAGNGRHIRPGQALALAAMALSLLPLVAYLYGFAVHHELTDLLPMPLHGSALMVLLTVAVLRLQPDGGVYACLTGHTASGAMARRLLPAALLVPLLIAALRIAGERAGLYGTELGVASMVVLNVGVLVALIWASAWSMHHAEGEVRRLAAIVESSDDAIFGKSLDGTILSWNAGARRVFGYAAAEVKGRRTYDVLIPPGRRDEEDWILLRLARGERVDQLDTVRLHKDGRAVDVSVTICPMRDAGGTITGASIIARDIGERKRLASAERERAGLEQAVAAMEQVLVVVGHELRTPLAGIRITSELLLDEGVRQSEQCGPLLQSINRESARMAGTVNDLLEAARLNTGGATWNWSEFGPGAACAGAVETVRPLIDGSRVTLALDAGACEFSMKGDAEAFARLVVNLVGNAAKFTADGRIDVTVREMLREESRWVELVVRDTGCGIAPELRGRLGQAFALNAGIVGSHHVGGTGLGLAICKGIVGAHGGVMEIESQVGRGTCVTVRLRADLEGPVSEGAACRLKSAA